MLIIICICMCIHIEHLLLKFLGVLHPLLFLVLHLLGFDVGLLCGFLQGGSTSQPSQQMALKLADSKRTCVRRCICIPFRPFL